MNAPEPTVVAIVYNEDGSEHDHAWSWETGQNFAQSGHVVKAVADDGHMTVAKAQALYDHERALYRDCFGIEPYPEEAK